MKCLKYEKWLSNNSTSLKGKTVAITGSTGGLGKQLCRYLLALGASLILVDRNEERSRKNTEDLKSEFGEVHLKIIVCDLESIKSVKLATEKLREEKVDIFIHNAGAYSIPRKICDTGYDNVFQINFVSPYYMIRELYSDITARGGKIIAVGSIAHNYSRTDFKCADFKDRKRASLVYGNAKRYLMYALSRFFCDRGSENLAIAHPGISFTGITAHYPKLVFAIIKYPMKIIFMKPEKACLSILSGVFETCEEYSWIGPKFFNIWGMPKKKRLKTATKSEITFIYNKAEEIYENIK